MKHNVIISLLTAAMMTCILTGCGNEASTLTENSVAIEETVESSETIESETAETVENESIAETELIVETEIVETTETEVIAATDTIKTESEETEYTETGVTEEVATETSETTEPPMVEENETVEEVTPQYTYSDMNKTMWVKSSVNLRDLPSTEGNKVGSLTTGEEVHVTGQCNETSWYRLEDGKYVSNNYLVDSKPVQPTTTPVANNTTPNQGTTYAPGTVIVCQTYEEADALCEIGDVIEIAEDGTISVVKGNGTIPNMSQPSYYSNPELATEILGLINTERSNRGLAQVTWDSSLDADALQSAVNVEATYSHDSLTIHPGNENIGQGQTTVQQIYNEWMASPGHEIAMMDQYLTSISCARYKNSWVFMGRVDVEKQVADFQQQIDNGEIEPISSTDVGGGQTIDVYGTPGAVFSEEDALANGLVTQEQIDAMNEISNQLTSLMEQGYSAEEAADIINKQNGF